MTLRLAIRRAWIKKNPDVSFQLCLDGSPIGVATVLPLQLEKIEQILQDKVSSEETSPDEIEKYVTGKAYHLYIMGVGVSPALNKQERRWYGAKLMRGISEAIIELGKRGIEIEDIISRSETVDGMRMLRHLGFTQIPSTIRKVNFIIKVNDTDIDIVQQYKKALRATKETSEVTA